jgi:hypothetical protein
MADPRVTRRDEERPKQWTPPNKAMNPIQIDGVRCRWVREYTNPENSDPTNVESKMSEGYVPVRATDPEVAHLTNLDRDGGDGLVRRKGLILMKIEDTLAEQRNNYYHKQAKLQQDTVDQTALEGMRRSSGAHNPEMELERSTSKPRVPTVRADTTDS